MREPILREQIAGYRNTGDIELLLEPTPAPVIAIILTENNGHHLGWRYAARGWRSVGVGGNMETPALDLLDHAAVDVVVLELSSFQLETTHSLNPKVARS